MRLSIDPTSPHFQPLAWRTMVYLDGQPLTYVQEADDTNGWFLRLEPTTPGSVRTLAMNAGYQGRLELLAYDADGKLLYRTPGVAKPDDDNAPLAL